MNLVGVRAENISMSFGGVAVLRDVSVELRTGEIHGIVGENGAGKSTLAKIIAGVYRPTAGTIGLNGQAVSFGKPLEALQAGIALIHQEPLSFPDLTVAENIFVGRQPIRGGRIDWRAMRNQAQSVLDSVGAHLDPAARMRGLSIADRQLVELASALTQNATVLLLDETTSSLTPSEVERLFEVVRRLRDEGKALAFVSHRLDEVFSICDRVTVLRDGEIAGQIEPSKSSKEEVVRLMVGRELSLGRPPATSRKPTGQPVLEVKGLTRKRKFANIDLTLYSGEIVGLAGLVGAGRTDIARVLFGLQPHDEGQILIDGELRRIRSPADAMRLGIALVPEDRQLHGLLLPMTIAGNSTLANLKAVSKAGWLNRKAELATAQIETGRLKTKLRTVRQPVGELSGGNQQKVVLAKWLLTKPRILILDEPTRGVDVGAKAEVHDLIRRLAAEGLAVLMISSDLPEILSLSDRILVMRAGKLVAEMDGQTATQEAVMQAATGQELHALG